LRYLSICSGIEAATVAWHPLDWNAAGYADVDRFARAVTDFHYSDVPNFGDFTSIRADDVGPIDLLVGGTPCQSFSIAGLRRGLDDDRGNLALEFCRLAQRTRPRWVVWENVPGVLSMDGGQAFASILGGLAECGYGLAYRVLDAQYVRVDGFGRAVPQRRRRVFAVGYLGDWRRAAAVLFEREGMRRDTPPRRQAGQGPAPTISARPTGGGGLGTDFDCDGGLIADVAGTLTNAGGNSAGSATNQNDAINELAPTLRAMGHSESHANAGGQAAVAFSENSRAELRLVNGDGQIAESLKVGGGKPGQSFPAVAEQWAVRRLTPMECERLQGFPDGYTAVPYRGKLAADGPRYKALGNSMAVNVMRWIGRRIEAVEKMEK